MDSITNYYINHIEPLLDGMSNGEATVFGILLTALIGFFIWLIKQLFTKKSKIITDKNNAERGEQTTTTVNNQLPNSTQKEPPVARVEPAEHGAQTTKQKPSTLGDKNPHSTSSMRATTYCSVLSC